MLEGEGSGRGILGEKRWGLTAISPRWQQVTVSRTGSPATAPTQVPFGWGAAGEDRTPQASEGGCVNRDRNCLGTQKQGPNGVPEGERGVMP